MAEREREKEVVEVGRSWDETAKKMAHMDHPSVI